MADFPTYRVSMDLCVALGLLEGGDLVEYSSPSNAEPYVGVFQDDTALIDGKYKSFRAFIQENLGVQKGEKNAQKQSIIIVKRVTQEHLDHGKLQRLIQDRMREKCLLRKMKSLSHLEYVFLLFSFVFDKDLTIYFFEDPR